MRSSRTLAFILTTLLVGCAKLNHSCEVHWRLGAVDPRFQISEADVLTAAFNAADAWNRAAGRRVLHYDKAHGIPLKLVYDEHSTNLSGGLSELRELRALDLAITNLKKQYDTNPSQYVADRINADVRRYNQLVASLNTRARDDIKQGSYQTELEIYAFADAADLQVVIAHEFGHALGIGHIEDAGAIMGARHQVGTILQLTDADAAALRQRCH